jgi:Bax protein
MKIFHWILKRKLLVLGLLVLMVTSNAQNVNYIARHQSFAERLAAQFGIPYDVILGIAIVESSAGQSKATKKLKNHFGMTGKTPLNKTVSYKTRYKAYSTDEESFQDFCEVVSRKKFYTKLRDTADSKQWIRALSMSGYSEVPKVWEKRVLSVISNNKL